MEHANFNDPLKQNIPYNGRLLVKEPSFFKIAGGYSEIRPKFRKILELSQSNTSMRRNYANVIFLMKDYNKSAVFP